MSDARKGGCLCGAITFEAVGKPQWVVHCHCRSCRRSTGSAAATFIGLSTNQFSYLTGEPQRYASSPGVSRSFCGQCGTPLAYEAEHYPGEIHVYVSVFDEPDAFPPQAHVYFAEKISWLHMDEDLKHFDTTARS